MSMCLLDCLPRLDYFLCSNALNAPVGCIKVTTGFFVLIPWTILFFPIKEKYPDVWSTTLDLIFMAMVLVTFTIHIVFMFAVDNLKFCIFIPWYIMMVLYILANLCLIIGGFITLIFFPGIIRFKTEAGITFLWALVIFEVVLIYKFLLIASFQREEEEIMAPLEHYVTPRFIAGSRAAEAEVAL